MLAKDLQKGDVVRMLWIRMTPYSVGTLIERDDRSVLVRRPYCHESGHVGFEDVYVTFPSENLEFEKL